MMEMKNGKDVLFSLWEILGMTYQFARIHSNGSGTAAFFFSLYLVCPFGFKFLTYTFATMYGAAIIIKIIANSAPYDLHEANLHSYKDLECPSLESDSDEQRPKKPTICAQMSKRRNFKTRMEDLETPDDAATTTNQAPSLCLDDRDHLEDQIEKINQKDDGMSTVAHRGASSCEGEEGMSLNEKDESICDFADETKQSLSEANDSSDDLEDEDEEDAPGERNQAVEWTEDDQQSLMDLGFSELERNKRLENLITKRKVKKATSMKIQENLLDLDISQTGSIPPINISRNPFLPPHLSGDARESHSPGSAPSVLLPERNPFDLPYDSNEEKPNLTVDGISAEIHAPHPKDILSRHESFFYGHSFPSRIDQDSGPANSIHDLLSEKRNLREPQYSRFRQQSDKDQHDEEFLSKVEDPKSQPDVHKNDETTNSIHDNLKASSDEKYRGDGSTGDEYEMESTSSTSEDQTDGDAESSTYDETLDRQTGSRAGGSLLDKGESQQRIAGSSDSSSDTTQSNGNQSSHENH